MVNLKNCLSAGVILFGAVFALYGNQFVGDKVRTRKVPKSGDYSVPGRGSSVYSEETRDVSGAPTASFGRPDILAPGLRDTAIQGGAEKSYI